MATEQILKELERRFLSESKEHEITQRFLSNEVPITAENFFEMIKYGRTLVDNE